jgi:hypothetical protein
MESFHFKISNKTIWAIVASIFVLTGLAAIATLQHWEFVHILFTAAIIIFFLTWIIIFGDMLTQKPYNQTFWIMSMFILAPLTMIFYLFQRNKLIRLAQKQAKSRSNYK